MNVIDFSFDLPSIWFLLVGVLFTGYAILDGFDFGVGSLHLFAKTDEERRIMFNAIGPVWDGNEVWLVTAGGALFAAFPEAYATGLSGFYIPIMLLLFGLIFRAVAIEFRSKRPMDWWRKTWDISFTVSSILSGLLLGIAAGNIAWGLPMDSSYNVLGSTLDLLHPYALLVGVTTVALFMMHGSIYVYMKTEGELHRRVRQWINNSMIFFIMCYVLTTMATLLYVPHMAENIRQHPWLFVLPVLNMLAIANIPREIHHDRPGRAFVSSCASMVALMALFGLGLYPNLVLAKPQVQNSLTVYAAASSDTTLTIMLIIAGIGMPLVLAYTTSVYWIFRGKVKLDRSSY